MTEFVYHLEAFHPDSSTTVGIYKNKRRAVELKTLLDRVHNIYIAVIKLHKYLDDDTWFGLLNSVLQIGATLTDIPYYECGKPEITKRRIR